MSTYKDDADVVVMSTRDRKLYKNLTKGYTTAYEYLVSQWVTTGPQSGADIAVSPDGNTVAVFARRERGRDLLLLNALTGGIRERVEMPDLDQQLNPTFSPDGTLVAFRALRGGRSDIYTYNLGTRALTNLTDDDAFDFSPAFSPDGRWIYYSSVRGTKSKIFRFHPDTPDSREQITYGDWNDEDPALSPDGKRLFFTSDRDSGIYNIYSIHLETGETFMHTNVVAGVFTPTVFVGKDNTEKLVYSAYYKGRFTLYIADSKKPFKRLPELAPVPSPVGPGGVTPFQPAIEVAVDPEKVTKKISRKLQLEDAQINAGVNTDQTFVSNTVLIFGDNLGDRRLYAIFQSLSSFTNFNFTYLDLSHRLQKGIQLFDDRTYFLAIDQSLGQDRLVRDRRAYRVTGGLALLQYPLDRYHRLEGQVGYISRSYDFPFAFTNNDGTQQFFVSARTDNYPQAGLAFVGDTVLYREWGPLSGRRYRFGYTWAPDLKKDSNTVDSNGLAVSNGSTLTAGRDGRSAPLHQDHGSVAHRGEALRGPIDGQLSERLLLRRPRHPARPRLPRTDREHDRLRQLRVPFSAHRSARLPVRRVRKHPGALLRRRRRSGSQGPEIPVLGREQSSVDRRQGLLRIRRPVLVPGPAPALGLRPPDRLPEDLLGPEDVLLYRDGVLTGTRLSVER